jgi:hypothetical protein
MQVTMIVMINLWKANQGSPCPFAMGQYSRTLLNDFVLNLVFTRILNCSWQDHTELFQNLHLCNKVWKTLINCTPQWLQTKFCLLVLHFECLATLEEQRVQQLKNYESRSYNTPSYDFEGSEASNGEPKDL